jgi:hypothetical protein
MSDPYRVAGSVDIGDGFSNDVCDRCGHELDEHEEPGDDDDSAWRSRCTECPPHRRCLGFVPGAGFRAG